MKTPNLRRALPAAAAAVALAACASRPTRAPAASAPSVPTISAAPAPQAAPPAAAVDPAPAMPAGRLSKVWGVVVSSDAGAGRVTVKDRRGARRVFRLAQGAKLTKGGGGAAIDLADVKAGDRVTLRAAGDVVGSLHVNVIAASAAKKP